MDTTDLTSKKCRACELGEGKLGAPEIEGFLTRLPAWRERNLHEIYRKYDFPDFKTAIAFVNQVGAIAEREGHHPDIAFGWGYVTITLTTHAVDGLSENDFIMAAKIEEVRK